MANDSEGSEASDLRSQIELARLELEQSRLALERQHEFLTRWNIGLDRPHTRALEAYKSAVGFAQSGLRSAVLMNGGALVALPTFATALNLKDGSSIIWPMTAFAFGIVSAVTAIMFAYLSSDKMIYGFDIEASKVTANLNKERAEGDRLTELSTAANEAEENAEEARKVVEKFASIGLYAAVASLAAFIVGAGLTAGLALQ